MQVWKGIIKTYISALYAGLCVILAASIYLLLWSFNLRPLGTVLFSVGLIIIVVFGFSLYTGKIGYAYAKDRPSLLTLLLPYLVMQQR